MKKNFLEIIGGILVFAFVVSLVIVAMCLKGKDKDKEKEPDNPKEPETKYELLDNDYITYDYISSYDEYHEFMEEQKFSKSDYYITFSEEDFEDQTYLFVVIPYDPCSESIEKDELKKGDDIYKIYLDMAYSCGLCAPSKKMLAYKVNKIDLKVKVYSKTVSREECDPNVAYKPIIYIYPEQDMDLTITLGNPNNLLYTYPKYENSWNVHVTTDGNIYDLKTKRNYYGLYWEGNDNYKLDMTTGFVVKGSDTVKFLEEKLAILGLNDYEINEFIIYWIDKLEGNNYNFISFRSLEDINKSMPLNLSKNPDTLIRVMMDYKPLDNYIEVKEQQLTKIDRKGFTVVEWGGTKH